MGHQQLVLHRRDKLVDYSLGHSTAEMSPSQPPFTAPLKPYSEYLQASIMALKPVSTKRSCPTCLGRFSILRAPAFFTASRSRSGRPSSHSGASDTSHVMKRTRAESFASGSSEAHTSEAVQRDHRIRPRRTSSESDLSISEISRILGIPQVPYPPSHAAHRAAVGAERPFDETRSALAHASGSLLPNVSPANELEADQPLPATLIPYDAHPVTYSSSLSRQPTMERDPPLHSGLFTAVSATTGTNISMFDELASTFDLQPLVQTPLVTATSEPSSLERGLQHLPDAASEVSPDVVFDFSFLDDIYAFSSSLNQHPPARETTPAQSQSTPRLAAGNVEDTAALPELLDFRELSTADDIALRFKLIASELIHRHRIEIRTASLTEQLEILEIEFYLFKAGCHEDPYTHSSVEQRRAGQWYFHRDRRSYHHTIASIKTSDYLSGTRKALSLTLGQPAAAEHITALYGGVLIRSVARASDGEVIHGPWAVVNEILRLSGTRTIDELTVTHWQGDISAIPPPAAAPPSQSANRNRPTVYVVRPPTSLGSALPITDRDLLLADGTRAVFGSPRVALELSDVLTRTRTPAQAVPSSSDSTSSPGGLPHRASGASPTVTSNLLSQPGVTFFPAPYRFYAAPYLVASSRSERAPTYLGVHDLLLASGQYTTATGTPGSSEMLDAAARLTGLQHTSKYFIALRDALKDPASEEREETVRLQAGSAGADIGDAADVELLREGVGADNKKRVQNALKWLQLVGTLRRLQRLARGTSEAGKTSPRPGSGHGVDHEQESASTASV
ncbi:hypothetical protein C8Q80DRAFT_1358597 [Daedaleopsis nitida]|nr:hypothetical protein C8Q80DRAFT_1358597 [Daedaleopsis nitida]